MQTSTAGEVGEARGGRGQTTKLPKGSTDRGAAVDTDAVCDTRGGGEGGSGEGQDDGGRVLVLFLGRRDGLPPLAADSHSLRQIFKKIVPWGEARTYTGKARFYLWMQGCTWENLHLADARFFGKVEPDTVTVCPTALPHANVGVNEAIVGPW